MAKMIDDIRERLLDHVLSLEEIDSVLEENKYLPIETDEDDIDTLKYSNNKSQICGKGKCCPDAIANALIDMYKEMKNSIFSDDIEMSNVKSKVIKKNTEDKEQSVNVKNPCPVCGEELTFEGGCNVCKACGWSKCD